MFDRPAAYPDPGGRPQPGPAPAEVEPISRPSRWSLTNWPVRWKVVAIAVVPLLLAAVFGGVRVYSSTVEARDLGVAADRAELVPAVTDYMSALENVLVVTAAGGDVAQARSDYDTRSAELEQRIGSTGPVSDVRLAASNLVALGTQLLTKVDAGQSNLREQVATFSPLLLTAETAITGSVRVADENVRLQAEGLARAVGARGQMAMQRMLVESGAALPEPELRSSMVALAGTEPSTVRGMAALLGGGSDDAAALRRQMVDRTEALADPASVLPGNPELLQSIQATDEIAQRLITDTTDSIITTVRDEAADARNDAIRDAAVVLAVFVLVLLIVWLVARSLTRPLSRLRDGALKIAHEDLVREIDRVKAGDEREPDPLPIHTTEEIGQVAHAVDELHTQALLLAGDEARLRVTVNDMFETMSRRNKSLVDQQLSLIDRLERDEEDPDRLDSLFRLDHLATRMRRNGANLLVLAGAQVSREQREPVPLASLIGAAASEVEEYQRVETGMVPDCAVLGSVAGDAVHLLAELIDNALRYSPPTEQVRVSAVHTSNGGVLVDVDDAGLGMTESDLRIANMRLNAGGEVSPDSARHMGLFVVGRLAGQHGMTVRLLAPSDGSGTTAQLYVPPELLKESAVALAAPHPTRAPAAETPPAPAPSLFSEPVRSGTDTPPQAEPASVTPLPRRNPGSSGITGAPVQEAAEEQPVWWESADESAEPVAANAPADTSGFFASRRQAQWETQDSERPTTPEPESEPEQEEPRPGSSDVDLIYQNMMNEWLVDPHELAIPQDWKSVWDNGWAAAAEVENVPVESHTDHGLPVRSPGARLVPGGTSPAERSAGPVNGTGHEDDERADVRDPDAIRSALGKHFSGVRAGRSHSGGNTTEGHDHE
ncbi:sensor histidine kinase [Mycolicibacterium mengxianglii]|uniref:sensor histidine kinase n=1 Tax=Mycolicibacterium mengxianglii TaxID=2736649 RepID=UPI0018D0E3AF|nr:ATP-binding protein [Mycolicibacterium mengxianglii]